MVSKGGGVQMLMRISCDDLGCGKSLALESNCFCSVTLGKPLALSVPHLPDQAQ